MKKSIFVSVLILVMSGVLLMSDDEGKVYAIGEGKNSINLEISQGFFQSTNDSFKTIYGSTYPTFLGVSYFWKENFKVLSGFRYYKKSGETILQPDINEFTSDKVSLSVLTIPFHMYYYFGGSNILPFIMGGFRYERFNEKWVDAGTSTSRSNVGYEAGGGVLFLSREKWSLSAGASYSSTRVGDEQQMNEMDIGGYNIFVQFSYLLFTLK